MPDSGSPRYAIRFLGAKHKMQDQSSGNGEEHQYISRTILYADLALICPVRHGDVNPILLKTPSVQNSSLENKSWCEMHPACHYDSGIRIFRHDEFQVFKHAVFHKECFMFVSFAFAETQNETFHAPSASRPSIEITKPRCCPRFEIFMTNA